MIVSKIAQFGVHTGINQKNKIYPFFIFSIYTVKMGPNPNKDFGMDDIYRLKIKIILKNNFENTNMQMSS